MVVVVVLLWWLLLRKGPSLDNYGTMAWVMLVVVLIGFLVWESQPPGATTAGACCRCDMVSGVDMWNMSWRGTATTSDVTW